MNVNQSLVQPCNYQDEVLFYVDNRAYATRNLRVCDGIYDVSGRILCIAFQRQKQNDLIYVFSQSEAEPHKFMLTTIGVQDSPELSIDIAKCQSVYKSR